MEKTELMFEGSVKNVLKVPQSGDFIFEYSDRFSVFDWGAMPDELEGKGAALASMADFFFNYLGKKESWENWELPEGLKRFKFNPLLESFKRKGMSHHGVGLGTGDNQYKIKPVEVIKPKYLNNNEWDYTVYRERPVNCLVPLEVVFRFGVPRGSSLLKRTANPDYVKELGLSQAPLIGEKFAKPIIEFSTKLEPSDRYTAYEGARDIAGLNEVEFETLKDFVSLVALRIKDIFKEIDVELWDGKLEFAFGEKDETGNRRFTLVDSIGPDELRLTYKGTQLSKETLRKFYRKSDWYEIVEKSKLIADERGIKDWKEFCLTEFKTEPPQLDLDLKNACEEMYKSLAQSLNKKFNGEDVFKSCWNLDQVIEKIDGDSK
ncbi:MAG: phosphoribosylaminoimidazolesuccinocarboxamide synthase [Halobacteriovorax sp.]|nr:phosphoribosylaminoimidazolesuccinocarboxamide synthase [Halobacteriovorax sp.]